MLLDPFPKNEENWTEHDLKEKGNNGEEQEQREKEERREEKVNEYG